jgi:hypothetical protein
MNSKTLNDIALKYSLLINRLRLNDQLIFPPNKANAAESNAKESEFYIELNLLSNLKARYTAIKSSLRDYSQWSEAYVQNEVNFCNFRGDMGYLYQQRDINIDLHYFATAEYVKSIDILNLFASLSEDDKFGAYVVTTPSGLLVSRDLLDSIVELYFLERILSLSTRVNFNILDIGAGYGRFGHRLVTAFPKLGNLFCVDAIPESTYISALYLQYRGVLNRASVVPLDEIHSCMASNVIDLAVNIHSFSECPLSAIIEWVTILKQYKVRYLMVVPHAGHFGDSEFGYHGGKKLLSCEKNGTRLDFMPVLVAHGYKLLRMDPKYLNGVIQIHGVSPTHHYLFARNIS